MVEIEVHKAEPTTGQTETTSLNVNEIIGKIRSFVDTIKTLQGNEEPMKVTVEGFNVTVGKEHDEYEFALKLNLTLKPTAA